MSPAKKAPEPRTAKGERYDYVSLAIASDEELETVMKLGVMPDLEKLAGWEFKGWNSTDMAYLIQAKKFKKGLYRDKSANKVLGYNVVVLQNGLGEPWIEKLKGSDAIRERFYEPYPVDLNEIDNRYPNALLLNYGKPKNNFTLDPARLLRDYLVQVYPDNFDLYLGKAFNALGPFRMFQGYFILEKNNRSLL